MLHDKLCTFMIYLSMMLCQHTYITARSISLLDEEYVPIDMQHVLPSNTTTTTSSGSPVSSGENVSKLASSEEKRDSKPVETLQAE